MGLDFFRGGRALLYPLLGAALGAAGYALAPHYIAIAILWTLAVAPTERGYIRMAQGAVISFAVRGLALSSIHPDLLTYIAIQTAPRAALIAMAWVSHPAANEAIDRFLISLNTPIALRAMAIGAAAALAAGVREGLVIILGSYLVIRGIRWIAYRYRDGVDLDALGNTQLLVEVVALLIFSRFFT